MDVQMSIKSSGLCVCVFSVDFIPNFFRDDEPGRGSRHTLAHMEQYSLEANWQQEAPPTCQNSQIGHTSDF